MPIVESTTSLEPWIQGAFRGNVPETVEHLLKHRETMDNVFTEMMTEWPANLREPMQHLHQLHKADTDLLYAVVENLFLRHLEHHP
jgi:hypothetical protein